MRWFPIVFLIGLVACDTAGPGFLGAEKATQEVEGSRFTLRFRGDVAEAVRTSPEWLPRFEVIARRAGIAAQIETGCRAAWVEGDPAMMWVGLSCDGKRAPKRPRRPRTLFCEISDLRTGAHSADATLSCLKLHR
ncbi:hypothetical protein [Antarctobacter jejuensis]|uniref:hypothetical protein n=1 Tax=Antarctobacter jejuensis TaxID=1439938 RepID=UPI003FD534C0